MNRFSARLSRCASRETRSATRVLGRDCSRLNVDTSSRRHWRFAFCRLLSEASGANSRRWQERYGRNKAARADGKTPRNVTGFVFNRIAIDRTTVGRERTLGVRRYALDGRASTPRHVPPTHGKPTRKRTKKREIVLRRGIIKSRDRVRNWVCFSCQCAVCINVVAARQIRRL